MRQSAPSSQAPQPEVPRPKPNLEMPTIEPEANYLGAISIIIAVLVVAAGVALYFINSTKNSELTTKNAEETTLETNLNTEPLKSQYKEIIATQKGIDRFNEIIDNQIKWSGMFKEYEKIIPKNVKITALTLDEDNLIKLNGEAGDYMGIAKFIQQLEDSNMFSDVKLVSSSISEGEGTQGITFSISYNVDETTLATSKTNANEQSQRQTAYTRSINIRSSNAIKRVTKI